MTHSSDAPLPHLSAIVPCRDFGDLGRRCVDRLMAVGGTEVILVPDTPADGLDPAVRCIVSGPVSPGIKRQLGLEAASAPYIGLIDDDAFPGPGWPDVAIAELERDPSIGAVAGPALTPEDEPLLGVLGGRVYASFLVSGPHRWRNAQVAPRDVDDAPSVNLVMRRADAEAVRLDSPWITGDDTVVCARILARGQRIRYLPGSVVMHSRRPLWLPHLRQLTRWARHRGTFARAGGVNSRRVAYFAPSALVLGLLGGVFTRGRLRGVWRGAVAGYALSCVVAGYDRRPGVWWRVSGAIAATHAAYGVGFLISLAGVPLPEERLTPMPRAAGSAGEAGPVTRDRSSR